MSLTLEQAGIVYEKPSSKEHSESCIILAFESYKSISFNNVFPNIVTITIKDGEKYLSIDLDKDDVKHLICLTCTFTLKTSFSMQKLFQKVS